MKFLDELFLFFMRTPKNAYNEDLLGSNFLYLYDKHYYRKDLIIKNRRGEKLRCCFFLPFIHNENVPCVIYSHSVNSCQLEIFDVLYNLLRCECSVFSFDHAGCGISEGSYATIGWNEAQDLFLILNHLRNVEKVKNIALWGKYSGAVSAIIVASLDKNIKLLILESPFVSLVELYKLYNINVNSKINTFFSNIYLFLARKLMIKHFNYDINNVCPVFFIQNITTPTIYILTQNDSLVHPIHTFYLANKQKHAYKFIYYHEICSKKQFSHYYENKLFNIIKYVLHDLASESEMKDMFNLYHYTKLFYEFKKKYYNEYYLLNKLIKRKEKYRTRIIKNVNNFIYFRFKSQISITSSKCLNQSTVDSIKDFNPNENEFNNFKQKTIKCISNDDIKFKKKDSIKDTNNFTNDEEIKIKPNTEEMKKIETNVFQIFNSTKNDDKYEHNNYKKLFHMQSSRSALKSKNVNVYKKSLTWDSNLNHSIFYFK